MLQIEIPETELYDYSTCCFHIVPQTTLLLEHSLLSISKWEEIHHTYLLENETLSDADLLDYVRCMTCNSDMIDPLAYRCITSDMLKKIEDYVADSHTATWFSNKDNTSSNSQKITSELIYSWMIDLQIWKECESWHLNKLFTLIKVRIEETKPKKKSNLASTISKFRDLKAARRKHIGR